MTKDRYHVSQSNLIIFDEELGLDFHGSAPDDVVREKKLSLVIEQSFFKGMLHGPTTVLDGEQVLSKSWFVEGSRTGKTHFYYPSGKLYSRERYVNGKRHGLQEFFYENGQVKSVLEYDQGMPVGMTQFFDQEGHLIRQVDQESET